MVGEKVFTNHETGSREPAPFDARVEATRAAERGVHPKRFAEPAVCCPDGY
jgi:hypothetical protein